MNDAGRVAGHASRRPRPEPDRRRLPHVGAVVAGRPPPTNVASSATTSTARRRAASRRAPRTGSRSRPARATPTRPRRGHLLLQGHRRGRRRATSAPPRTRPRAASPTRRRRGARARSPRPAAIGSHAQLGRRDGQRRRRPLQRPPRHDAGFTPSRGEPDRAADGHELHRHRLAAGHLLLQGHRRGRRRQRRRRLERGERDRPRRHARRRPSGAHRRRRRRDDRLELDGGDRQRRRRPLQRPRSTARGSRRRREPDRAADRDELRRHAASPPAPTTTGHRARTRPATSARPSARRARRSPTRRRRPASSPPTASTRAAARPPPTSPATATTARSERDLDDGGQVRRARSPSTARTPGQRADSASLDLTTGMTLEAWVQAGDGRRLAHGRAKEQPGQLRLRAVREHRHQPSRRPRSSSRATTSSRGPSTLPVGAWTHVAATYDGSTLRLFVERRRRSRSSASTGAIATDTGPLRIGGNGVWGEWFNGLIDEVRVYNRALSAAEIQNDMVPQHHARHRRRRRSPRGRRRRARRASTPAPRRRRRSTS